MYFDETIQRVVMLGGVSATGAALSDAYQLTATGWIPYPINGNSPGLVGPAMAYDPHSGTVVAFGGTGQNGPSSELWVLRDQRWTPLFAEGPSPRSGSCLAYLPTARAMVVKGGLVGASRQTDTWLLQYRNFSPTESCFYHRDDDGDGLFGCDDQDCWGYCDPACPPTKNTCDAQRTMCGDGVCDDNETYLICNTDCQTANTCGDGLVDANEECDTFAKDSASCAFFCQQPRCGDRYVNGVEVCDDGNTNAGDGCSASCLGREVCGDGFLDTATGEVCDDNNSVSHDGCSGDCRLISLCGDSVISADEVCDDSNRDDLDGCSGNCDSTEICGNGFIDYTKGEICDDANTIDFDGCMEQCTVTTTCGNQQLEPGEACDDGNVDSADGCSFDCLSNETCGNGYQDFNEGCDDGNTNNGDMCDSNCQVETPTCPNGVQEAGEECDDGNFDNEDLCSTNCTINPMP